jgi:hypothetical protein
MCFKIYYRKCVRLNRMSHLRDVSTNLAYLTEPQMA